MKIAHKLYARSRSYINNYHIEMQEDKIKSLQLRKTLGEEIQKIRKGQNISCLKLANEYSINDSNLNKIERAEIDCKFITLWKIAEALGLKPFELVRRLEEKLGKDFKLIDE